MNKLIPGNVYSNKEIPNANQLYSKLVIFPTPFKSIYYLPYESERSGWFITNPDIVLSKALRLYLKSDQYYFGLYSSLYYLRIIWNSNGTDVINAKLSRVLTRKLPNPRYWRGATIAKIMNNYSFPIRFHRMKIFSHEDTVKNGSIVFSNLDKTMTDANYLCKKGNKTACEVLALIKK